MGERTCSVNHRTCSVDPFTVHQLCTMFYGLFNVFLEPHAMVHGPQHITCALQIMCKGSETIFQ